MSDPMAPEDRAALVARLRDPAFCERTMTAWNEWRRYIAGGGGASFPRDQFENLLDGMDEERGAAADEITALAARIEALEAALVPFAHEGRGILRRFEPGAKVHAVDMGSHLRQVHLTAGDFQRAGAALADAATTLAVSARTVGRR